MIDRTSEFIKILKQCQKDTAKTKSNSILNLKNKKTSTLFEKHSKHIVSIFDIIFLHTFLILFIHFVVLIL